MPNFLRDCTAFEGSTPRIASIVASAKLDGHSMCARIAARSSRKGEKMDIKIVHFVFGLWAVVMGIVILGVSFFYAIPVIVLISAYALSVFGGFVTGLNWKQFRLSL
jgi:hypothetical protein